MTSCPQKAALSVASASRISLSKPFTPRSLKSIRSLLRSSESYDDFQHPRNASVLIPFCNVNNEPSILFELRARALRSHSGEISFPGGKVDETDQSFIDAALRETHEELGISPSSIEILGSIGPPEMNKTGQIRVWPIVGFVHADDASHLDEDTPLPSLDVDAIRSQASGDEVETAFHLPLSTLISPARLKPSLYRGAQPYWSVDVTDIVSSHDSTSESLDEDAKGTRHEVWGLTGWYLSLMMKRLQIYH